MIEAYYVFIFEKSSECEKYISVAVLNGYLYLFLSL